MTSDILSKPFCTINCNQALLSSRKIIVLLEDKFTSPCPCPCPRNTSPCFCLCPLALSLCPFTCPQTSSPWRQHCLSERERYNELCRQVLSTVLTVYVVDEAVEFGVDDVVLVVERGTCRWRHHARLSGVLDVILRRRHDDAAVAERDAVKSHSVRLTRSTHKHNVHTHDTAMQCNTKRPIPKSKSSSFFSSRLRSTRTWPVSTGRVGSGRVRVGRTNLVLPVFALDIFRDYFWPRPFAHWQVSIFFEIPQLELPKSSNGIDKKSNFVSAC